MHYLDLQFPRLSNYELQKDISAYIYLLVQTLPALDHQLQVVKQAQDSDETCIKSYCLNGWPDHSRLQGIIKK